MKLTRLLGLIILLSSGAFAQISNPAFLWRPQPNPAPPPCPRIRQFYNLSGTFQQIDCNGVITTISNLSSLQDPGANGFVVRTSPNITTARTLTGTLNRIVIVNGDGSANPVFDIGSSVATSGNNLSFFSSTTSAQLAGVISDETGSGSLVFGTSPTINTATINTPAITGGTHTAITSLGIRSTGSGAFDLTFANTENLTAARTLTITLNNVARTLSLNGNLTTGGSFTTTGTFSSGGNFSTGSTFSTTGTFATGGNFSTGNTFSTTGTFSSGGAFSTGAAFTTTPANALTLTTTGATNVTLPTTGTLATLAGTETLSNKTLASPRVTAGLFDSNGNESILTPAAASAVNEFTIANAATGAGPALSATGNDTNIPVNLSTKGTGNFVVNSNGIARVTVAGADANTYFGNGITNASPANYAINGTGGSGTNIAGAHLDLAPGKGTGNAIPGQVAVRYPLIGATGTTLQSLSADRFPVSTSLYTNTTVGTAVANTTSETSIFTGVTASSGSTLTIQAGSARAGTVIRLRLYGVFNTTGTPTIRFRVKLGSVSVIDTGAATSPNNAAGLFFFDTYIYINAIGASGLVRADFEGKLTTAISGTPTTAFIVGAAAEPTVDFTANQTIDVTAQWGTASASNNTQLLTASIERYRN